jgi:hypothetical protein
MTTFDGGERESIAVKCWNLYNFSLATACCVKSVQPIDSPSAVLVDSDEISSASAACCGSQASRRRRKLNSELLEFEGFAPCKQ